MHYKTIEKFTLLLLFFFIFQISYHQVISLIASATDGY